jgi:hypothetical protein
VTYFNLDAKEMQIARGIRTCGRKKDASEDYQETARPYDEAIERFNTGKANTDEPTQRRYCL